MSAKAPARTVVELTPQGRIVREYDEDGRLLRVRREPHAPRRDEELPAYERTQLPPPAAKPAEPKSRLSLPKPKLPRRSAPEAPAPEAAETQPEPQEAPPKKARTLALPKLGRKKTRDAEPAPAEPSPAEPEAAPHQETPAEPAPKRAARAEWVVDDATEKPAETPAPPPPAPKKFQVLQVERVAAPEPARVEPPAPEPEPTTEPAAPPADAEPAPAAPVEEPATVEAPEPRKRGIRFGKAAPAAPPAEEAPKRSRAFALPKLGRKKEAAPAEPETPVTVEPVAPLVEDPVPAPAPEPVDAAPEPEPEPVAKPRRRREIADLDARVDELIARSRKPQKKRAPLAVPAFEPLEPSPTQRMVDEILARK